MALSGIDTAEKVVDDLMPGLIRLLDAPQTSQSALQLLLTIAAGSVGTNIAPLFGRHDFFGALIFIVSTTPDHKTLEMALTCLGVLATLGSLGEGRDLYREHIADFVDEEVADKMLFAMASTMQEFYTEQQELDAAAQRASGWLASFFKTDKPSTDPETQKWPSHLCILLSLHAFTSYNRVFAAHFIKSSAFGKTCELVSVLCQKQHLTPRYRQYNMICLMILRMFIEETAFSDQLVSPENKQAVKVYQDRSGVCEPRVLMSGILHAAHCCLRSNVRRKRMDYKFYCHVLALLFQAIGAIRASRQTVEYEWQMLWQTLFSLVKHISKLAKEDSISELGAARTVELVMLVMLSAGFNPNVFAAEDHESLIYRLLVSGEPLNQAIECLQLQKSVAAVCITSMISQYEMLESNNEPLGAAKIGEILKQGRYELAKAPSHDPTRLAIQSGWLAREPEQNRLVLRLVATTAFADALSLSSL